MLLKIFPSRLLVVVVLLAGLIGCDRQSPAPTPPPAPPTAQDRFDRVVEHLRNRLEDDGSGSPVGRITIRDSAGTANTAYTYRVEAPPKISKPKEEGGNYRAAIKVTLETTYSATRKPPPIEEDKEEEDKSPDRFPTTDDLSDATDPEVLDSRLVPELSRDFGGAALDPPDIATHTGRKGVRVTLYHLEYRKNKWTFAVPPPHDALPSANDAMERALKRQG